MSTFIAWFSSITVLFLLANDGGEVAFIGLLWFAVMISLLLYVLVEHFGPGIRRDGE